MARIFFFFLIFCFGASALLLTSSSACAQNNIGGGALCEPKIEAQVKLAFNVFWLERDAEFRTQIGRTVCSGTNGATPMPSREEVNALLGFSPNAGNEQATECYNCFGRMFIAKSLEVRDELEACLKNADCKQGLCPDSATRADQTGQSRSSSETGSGQPRALHDVYDDNARDLMAIP